MPGSASPARARCRSQREAGTTRKWIGRDAGACARPQVRELRLLLPFLRRRGRRRRRCGGVVLGDLAHALLELLHARAERLGEVRQTLGPEEDEDDDEDEQQLLISQTKHGGTPFRT